MDHGLIKELFHLILFHLEPFKHGIRYSTSLSIHLGYIDIQLVKLQEHVPMRGKKLQLIVNKLQTLEMQPMTIFALIITVQHHLII